MLYFHSILSIALALPIFATASPLSQNTGQPAPGSKVSLLFINTTTTDLTAYVQQYEPAGQTTYLINCAKAAESNCDIGDATISIVQGQTYDFHTANNNGGALTIHCSYETDGRTPAQCTRTVAGGPDGFEVETSNPSDEQWAYMPVLITTMPERNGYNVPGVSAGTAAGATATASGVSAATSVSDHNAVKSASPSSTSPALLDDPNAADNLVGGRLSIATWAAVAFALTQVFFLSA